LRQTTFYQGTGGKRSGKRGGEGRAIGAQADEGKRVNYSVKSDKYSLRKEPQKKGEGIKGLKRSDGENEDQRMGHGSSVCKEIRGRR